MESLLPPQSLCFSLNLPSFSVKDLFHIVWLMETPVGGLGDKEEEGGERTLILDYSSSIEEILCSSVAVEH